MVLSIMFHAKESDCWIIIEEDGLPRYCYDPHRLSWLGKEKKQQ